MTTHLAEKKDPRRFGTKHLFQEIAEHAMCGVGANLDIVPSREAVRPYLGVVGPSYKDVMDRLFDAAEELRDPDGADIGKLDEGFSNMQTEQYDDAVYVWFPDVPYADYPYADYFDEY